MANKARKLTPPFVETAKDGEWPDTVAVGLVLCVTNGGKGKSWEYRYTSPTKSKEKDGKRKYTRRSKGLGSAKAAVGGVSLVEAREQAVLLSKQVRDGTDPIDAAKTAKFENEVRAGEALTVFDAMKEYYRVVLQHKSPEYRRHEKRHFDRIHKALATVPIKMLAEHPQLIVDKLGMLEGWHDHRGEEERMLFHLRSAINTVMRRCKIATNPAVVKGCLQYRGLILDKTKARGHYKALPYQDAGRLMKRIRENVHPYPSGYYRMGERTNLSYLLEFVLLSCVRPGEVRQAQWKEFDEHNKIWVAPIGHLKPVKGGNFPRPIPITKPMQDVLNAMKARRVDQSGDAYVFPSPAPTANGKRGQPYSKEKGSGLLNELWPEFRIHPHGFRTTLRTWCRGPGKYPVSLAERQQGRREKGVGGGHYSSEDRPYLDDETLDDRRRMMEHWGKYCKQVNPPSTQLRKAQEGILDIAAE
jgi:integrase